MSTSATGGYLVPLSPTPPLEDSNLDIVIQNAIVGISGLPGNMVRPRWQAIEPKQPDQLVDWASFGIMEIKPDANAAIVQDGDTQTDYYRHEELDILVSFYGPDRNFYAETFRDGFAIPQNLEALKNNLINYKSVGIIVSIPELINLQWIRRNDVRVYLRRKIQRQYAVESILEVGTSSELIADSQQGILVDPIIVNP